jgi:hypothetical protein
MSAPWDSCSQLLTHRVLRGFAVICLSILIHYSQSDIFRYHIWYHHTVRSYKSLWSWTVLAWPWGLIWQWAQRLPKNRAFFRVKTKVHFSFMAHLLPNSRRFLYAALHGRPTEMPDALDYSANVEQHSMYMPCVLRRSMWICQWFLLSVASYGPWRDGMWDVQRGRAIPVWSWL